MNKDFSKHQTLIDSFRGQVNQSNFEAKFTASTKKLSKTETFLLKMELKRLASPCTRSIDLRGLVDGECKIYEHEGQSHFLDEVAVEEFEKNVALYGSYTFGVYEAVKNTKNNFRVIYQNEQAGIKSDTTEVVTKVQEKTQYPAKRFQFREYYDRIEERMNFAIALVITLSNKQEIPATSSDISVNGCKFRLTEQAPLSVGDAISIKFTGMEQEFQFGSTDIFSFKVQNSHQDGDTQLLGCKRVGAPDNDAFKNFISSYIQGNKRRYKINLDNTIHALQSRSFEQFILPKLNELPVFISEESSQLLPRYALTTNNNQAIFQYWQDEAGHSTLHYLLNEQRLARIEQQKGSNKSLLVYSFIHQHQGKSFFYSFDEQQLPNNNALSLSILAFAAKKASFAITELSCCDVDIKQAYAPYTLSNTRSLDKQYINLPPSDEVKACLTHLPEIVVVRDITHPCLVTQYQQLSSDKVDTQALKVFGHKRQKTPLVIDELGISYKNQRQELRFLYDTEAIVECDNVRWSGRSHDFSVSGLKIQLDDSAMLSMGDIVYLSFPKLQKITSAFDLKKLPYEIVRINKKKTIINLRVFVKEHQHIGRAFFKLLIEKNRQKLTPDEYAMLTPGLPSALRTCYAKSMNSTALLVQTSGSRYKMEVLACNDENSELLHQMQRLSDRQRYYNLYPLLTKLQTDNSLEQSLKALLSNEEPVTKLIYVAIDLNSDKVEKSVNVVLESELNTPELKQFFIRKALKRGQFYCLQLKVSRTNEPDMDFLNAELSYISGYAIHRGKQIEQDIWSVVGVIQVFDVTKEALLLNKLAR